MGFSALYIGRGLISLASLLTKAEYRIFSACASTFFVINFWHGKKEKRGSAGTRKAPESKTDSCTTFRDCKQGGDSEACKRKGIERRCGVNFGKDLRLMWREFERDRRKRRAA